MENKVLFKGNEIELWLDNYDPDVPHYTINKKGWRSSVSYDGPSFEKMLSDLYNEQTPGIK